MSFFIPVKSNTIRFGRSIFGNYICQLSPCCTTYLHSSSELSGVARGGNKGKANAPLRQARFLKKLITGSSSSKKKFFTVDSPASKSLSEFGANVKGVSGVPSKSKKCLRRVQIFNTLFMEQISSLMSTGEASSEILGLGITISRVKISDDLSRVCVYWIASGTEQDEVIEQILKKTSGVLRHELSQLRIMGMVPPIEFHKDKNFYKVLEVEHLFNKCDFGEDFTPTTNPNVLFSQSTSLTKNARSYDKDNSGLGEVEEFDNQNAEEQLKVVTEAQLYKNIPMMRQDLLGVRHDFIMEQIKGIMGKIKNKSNAKHANIDKLNDHDQPDSYFELSTSATGNAEQDKEKILEAKQRQQEFFKYLKKVQIEKSRELKQFSTAAKDKEFYDEQAFERWKENIENQYKDDDNIDEDEVENIYEESYFTFSNSNSPSRDV